MKSSYSDEVKSIICNEAGAIFLEDSSVTLYGYKLYGSPWNRGFPHRRDMHDCTLTCQELWENIPTDTDILMTHPPSKGHGDKSSRGILEGCEKLLYEIEQRVKPLVHVFGHIHEDYGFSKSDIVDTLFINAGICNHERPMKPLNKPIVFDLPLLVNCES